MSESVVFLDYQGQVDLPTMELLLSNLKRTKEFSALNKTTGKRTYAVFVECLENIYKHSSLNPLKDRRMQPHVSVRKENDKVIISAGNPVPIEAKDILARKIEQINNSDESALKSKYEHRLNGDHKQENNGTGLGFIFMVSKSGNKISYSFKPLSDEFSYFEIQISINKYVMRKLIIEQTASSPKVILDPDKKIFLISGESRPPDVREFYEQIIMWLNDFRLYLTGPEGSKDPVSFNFNFEYFNSSSGKLILDICKILAGLGSKGINITVNWHFEKDDVDMLEVGKEMSKIVKFPFEYIEEGSD